MYLWTCARLVVLRTRGVAEVGAGGRVPGVDLGGKKRVQSQPNGSCALMRCWIAAKFDMKALWACAHRLVLRIRGVAGEGGRGASPVGAKGGKIEKSF